MQDVYMDLRKSPVLKVVRDRENIKEDSTVHICSLFTLPKPAVYSAYGDRMLGCLGH